MYSPAILKFFYKIYVFHKMAHRLLFKVPSMKFIFSSFYLLHSTRNLSSAVYRLTAKCLNFINKGYNFFYDCFSTYGGSADIVAALLMLMLIVRLLIKFDSTNGYNSRLVE